MKALDKFREFVLPQESSHAGEAAFVDLELLGLNDNISEFAARDFLLEDVSFLMFAPKDTYFLPAIYAGYPH